MTERRGSKLYRSLDRYLGSLLLFALYVLLPIGRLVFPKRSNSCNACLVVCFGAIGDLIVLTEAVKSQLANKRVYLACSQLNYGAAKIYSQYYAGIEPVNIKDLFSLHKITKKVGVETIYDSTQWANIGPIQVGLAALFSRHVTTHGFMTDNWVRNGVYNVIVDHLTVVHEFGNFVNLLSGKVKISSNEQLGLLLPKCYSSYSYRKTGKVLFHMWPSGNRSHLKAWPSACWKELAENLVDRGYELYLSGAVADQEQTESFVRELALDNVKSIAGSMSLAELRSFIQEQIEFAVSVNTGILHLVASCGVPLVGLHGGVNPARWGPLGINAISLLPETGRSAYLHYGFEYPENDNEAYVLDRLSVSQVVRAVDRLIAKEYS